MSRRSVILKRKAAQAKRVGHDPASVLIPDRVVKSDGRTTVKLPVLDRETKEPIAIRLEPGVATRKVGTRPTNELKARRMREIL